MAGRFYVSQLVWALLWRDGDLVRRAGRIEMIRDGDLFVEVLVRYLEGDSPRRWLSAVSIEAFDEVPQLGTRLRDHALPGFGPFCRVCGEGAWEHRAIDPASGLVVDGYGMAESQVVIWEGDKIVGLLCRDERLFRAKPGVRKELLDLARRP